MIIYCLTSPSGKHYIGQTTQPLSKRWKQHVDDAKRKTSKLGSAIKKHGSDNWTKRVVWQCNDRDTLNLMEEHFIAVLGDYNILPGGDCGPVAESTRDKLRAARARRPAPSAETRAKTSAALKGRKMSAQHRANLSAAQVGRVMSQATRDKISATKRKNRV